jgi:sporulation protein YlmC with PRC-barrel domain
VLVAQSAIGCNPQSEVGMANRDKGRGRSDAAGVGPYVRKGARLARLSELRNYKVADGEPDIRGWEVRTISGRQLGEVTELLVDTEAGEVVMIDVDVRDSGRHGFAPVRAAMIDRTARVVRLDTGDLQDEELPSLAITGSDERGAREAREPELDEVADAPAEAPADEHRATGGTVRYRTEDERRAD